MISLLIVEDDLAISEMLRHFLEARKYSVKTVSGGEQALEVLAEINPDLILLDWMLPDMSGPEIIKVIRQNPVQKDLPVLMLTARAEEMDKVEGLDAGADDYMTKPVSLQELHARIRALIRRSQGLNQDRLIRNGEISLDPENHLLKINNEVVKIAQTEFKLLHYLMRRPDRLHSRSQLLDQVWGQGVYIEERTVDVHVLRLRKLLKPFGLADRLQTVRGEGYRFSGLDNEP